MKTTTTKANQTKSNLDNLMQERNKMIELLEYNSKEFEQVNAKLIQTISEIATYKTLKLLMCNNGAISTQTETNENGLNNTYGFNMALKLFNNAYNDIKILNNPEIITDILTETADLIQTANETLTPYFLNQVIFNLDDIIFTKQLKNGNLKEYNAFQLACKSIRAYIQEQDKRQFKKLSYSLGYTENGNEILTTKRPKNDITDIEQDQKQKFINKYNLTSLEQEILLLTLNGLDYKAIINQLNISKDMFYRALKSAKEKIAKQDKRIKL